MLLHFPQDPLLSLSGKWSVTISEANIEIPETIGFTVSTVELKFTINPELCLKSEVKTALGFFQRAFCFPHMLSYSGHLMILGLGNHVTENFTVRFEVPRDWQEPKIQDFVRQGFDHWFEEWERFKRAAQ